MLLGAVFEREIAFAPRARGLYVARAVYAAALLAIVATCWLVVTGTQSVATAGDTARFGATLMRILAPLQLTLAMLAAALTGAVAVSTEKDRRTLELLLVSRLTDRELVLGKLAASLVRVLLLLLAAVPMFAIAALFGGVTAPQLARMFAVTVAASLAAAIRTPSREVWDNPILWREIRTRAYGRMIVVVRIAWLLLFAVAVAGILGEAGRPRPDRLAVALAVVPMVLASLVAVTALAVTSVTTERDRGSLDLLLVSDLEPAEFVWGKLLGVLTVAREIVLLPLVLCGALVAAGITGLEGGLCLGLGMAVLLFFAAVLGFHVGLSYDSSRRAIAVALGTVTFLFVGVATAMRIMVAFGSSFELQLAPFLAVIVGGAIGLYAALSARNPSPAIGWASALLPALTFVAITSFLQGNSLQVLFVTVVAYGFATLALLVPAIGAFDLLTGRTTSGE